VGLRAASDSHPRVSSGRRPRPRRPAPGRQGPRQDHLGQARKRSLVRRCARCGHTAAGNRVSQAGFRCLACGHQANPDVNAARNILRAGLALQEAQKPPEKPLLIWSSGVIGDVDHARHRKQPRARAPTAWSYPRVSWPMAIPSHPRPRRASDPSCIRRRRRPGRRRRRRCLPGSRSGRRRASRRDA
jgi:hypothetical protein